MKHSQLEAHLRNYSASVASTLPGADNPAVQAVRERALKRFAAVGLPKLTDEAWKYTSIRPMERIAFEFAKPEQSALDEAQLHAKFPPRTDAHRIVLVNGWFSQALSTLEDLPAGVEIVSLAAMFSNLNGSKIAAVTLDRLSQRAADATDGFAACSAGLAADGVVIRAGAGISVEKPIEILWLSQRGTQATLCNANGLVYAEADARLKVVEQFASLDETNHLTNAALNFELQAGAEVHHYRIQNESPAAFHIGATQVRQAADSRYAIFSLALGASLHRHEIVESLGGPGAHCILSGLSIGSGSQHIDNHTSVEHASANAASEEYYKGILDDRSRSVFHGRVIVNQDAQHTDAQQQNRNLLLSPDAEADTKPQLEIYADDVKCSHGATVGQLDEDAVFYLRARGLSETAARELLTQAFAAEMIDNIELDSVRDQVAALVHRKIGGLAKQAEAA